jgi:hypothetical protein
VELFEEFASRVGRPDRRLANLIDTSTEQIYRWKRRRSPIPEDKIDFLQDIADVTPRERQAWYSACAIQRCRQKYRASIKKAGRPDTVRTQLERAIENAVLRTHKSRIHFCYEDELAYLVRAYNFASVILDRALQFFCQDGKSFLDESNVANFVRHPANLIIINLLDELWKTGSDDCVVIAEHINESMVLGSRLRDDSEAALRLREFSVTMRLRTGDKGMLSDLRPGRPGYQPYLERAFRLALPLLGRLEEAEPLVGAITRNDELGKALVNFERVHFGDAHIGRRCKYDLSRLGANNTIKGIGIALLGPNDPQRDSIRKAQIARLIEDGHLKDCDDATAKVICELIAIQIVENNTRVDRWLTKSLASIGIDARSVGRKRGHTL